MMVQPGPQHEALKKDVIELLRKHASHVTAAEILAIMSVMVGQVIAMQDHRVMTPGVAMDIVLRNIQIGNGQAITDIN